MLCQHACGADLVELMHGAVYGRSINQVLPDCNSIDERSRSLSQGWISHSKSELEVKVLNLDRA